jgi:hypothetical protein
MRRAPFPYIRREGKPSLFFVCPPVVVAKSKRGSGTKINAEYEELTQGVPPFFRGFTTLRDAKSKNPDFQPTLSS